MQATLLLGIALTISAPALKDLPKTDPRIVGEWEVEDLTLNGKALNLNGVHMPFRFTSDGRWSQWNMDATAEYTVSQKGSPRTIDMSGTPGKQQPTSLGIFRIDGDTLTMCLAAAHLARPTKFESTADSKTTLYVMMRVKEK